MKNTFFAGGSNSIRAWQPRRLGPGAYGVYTSLENEPIRVDYNIEQPGDIILESSVELRGDLIGFIDYALFLDAGNIWLWKSETINSANDEFGNPQEQPDDGVFKWENFPKEIAVGGGFGLRLDFSFLILRLDLAYKILDPAYPVGDRFVLREYQVSDLWNLRDKAALNIGIGYPF